MISKTKDYIALLRPTHWLKNVFVILPLFFSGEFLVASKLAYALGATIIFCLASSAIYCLNDIFDADRDRRHPVKCHRPVASGKVSVGAAYVEMAIVAFLALYSAWMLAPEVRVGAVGVIVGYWAINLIYNLGAKHIPIVDAVIVSLGFVLRVVFGGLVCDIPLSPWIVVMTMLITLMLSFGKRRADVEALEISGETTRPSVKSYNRGFVDTTMAVLAAITVQSYLMYTLSPTTIAQFSCNYVYATTIFVVVGILRFLQCFIVKRAGSPVETFLRDPLLLGCSLCWILSFVFIIYL